MSEITLNRRKIMLTAASAVTGMILPAGMASAQAPPRRFQLKVEMPAITAFASATSRRPC